MKKILDGASLHFTIVSQVGAPTHQEIEEGIHPEPRGRLGSQRRQPLPGGHHGPHHFGWGFSAQFPTGSGETLSSGKYSLGPAVEYEYIGERLFIAIVALQLWSVAGDDDRKDVNMMMVKPMITWDFNEKWKAVYMPYGISAYWNKPSGQKWYVPLGGGIQRQFNIGSKPSAFSVQYFHNAVRPDGGAEDEVHDRSSVAVQATWLV